MPKVSVIIPVYKVEKYLMQCVESVLNQTLEDIEVFLIDEGDLDECRAIIDMYVFGAKKDERVRGIHYKNGGYGASVNRGLELAKGEYVFILESDDFIKNETLEELYGYAKRLDADIVKTPYYEYIDGFEEREDSVKICDWQKDFLEIPEEKVFLLEEYPQFLAVHPSIWSALYKRDFLEKNDIRCLEANGAGYVDNYFRIETLLKATRIAWKNKPYNYYRLSNPNSSQALYNLSTFIQRWNDVHKMLERDFFEKKDIIVPYCLIEEYTNVFKPLFNKKYTLLLSDYEILLENFGYISVDNIIESRLSMRRKQRLLELKRSPEKLERFLKSWKPSFFSFIPFVELGEVV